MGRVQVAPLQPHRQREIRPAHQPTVSADDRMLETDGSGEVEGRLRLLLARRRPAAWQGGQRFGIRGHLSFPLVVLYVAHACQLSPLPSDVAHPLSPCVNIAPAHWSHATLRQGGEDDREPSRDCASEAQRLAGREIHKRNLQRRQQRSVAGMTASRPSGDGRRSVIQAGAGRGQAVGRIDGFCLPFFRFANRAHKATAACRLGWQGQHRHSSRSSSPAGSSCWAVAPQHAQRAAGVPSTVSAV